MDLLDRPVLVAGARRTGASVAAALLDAGARVTVTDADPVQLAALAALEPRGVRLAVGLAVPPAGTALVVASPGWWPSAALLTAAAARGIEVIGEPELAWRLGAVLPAGPPAWLAVTGTNGKTTTVGMLEAILLAAGCDAVACGNVGLPVLDAVRAGHRVLAVELSSFQLHWSPSVRPAAGAVLNVAEDHLDWHGSMAAYAAAKARLLTGAVAVAGVDDPLAAELLAGAPASLRIGFTAGPPAPGQLGVLDGALVDRAFGPEPVSLAGLTDLAATGPPALRNALAAAALARAHGLGPAAVRAGLRAFLPGCHRGAVVAEAGGVRFVDDSKATNPHAASASLSAYPRVVWIAGGLLKGARVDTLVVDHRGRLAGVVALGTDRAVILAALARHAPQVPAVEVALGDHDAMAATGTQVAGSGVAGSDVTAAELMSRAVRAAAAMAGPGDVVLLAPAAASTDLFRDYAHRGRAFADAAGRIAATLGSRR